MKSKYRGVTFRETSGWIATLHRGGKKYVRSGFRYENHAAEARRLLEEGVTDLAELRARIEGMPGEGEEWIPYSERKQVSGRRRVERQT